MEEPDPVTTLSATILHLPSAEGGIDSTDKSSEGAQGEMGVERRGGDGLVDAGGFGAAVDVLSGQRKDLEAVEVVEGKEKVEEETKREEAISVSSCLLEAIY
jgi:hypothetical protein